MQLESIIGNAIVWNSMNEGVVITDPSQNDNPIIFVNNSFCSMTGYSKEEVLGKNCRFLNASLNNPEMDKLRNAIKNKCAGKVILQNKKRSGEVFWIELSLSPILNDKNQTIGFLGIQRDISSEIKVENELAEKSLFLSSLIINIPGVVYQWVEEDGRGQFTYVSDKLKTYFNIDPVDFATLPNLIHPEDAVRWRESIERANAAGTDWFFEGRLLYPDGSIKWWQGSSTQVKRDQNRITYNGLMLDISKKKKLEEELELERSRLEASAKMISLGEMSAGIAHEINNPLSVITGHAGLMQKALGKEPYDIRRALDGAEKIAKMSDRIARIIKSLRQFAKNDQSDPMQVHNLREIIHESLELLSLKIENSGARVEVEMSNEVQLWCRPVQISQVIMNLVANAIDATDSTTPSTTGIQEPAKWVRIQVRKNHEWIEVLVSDSGPGIPKNIKNRIMEPFFTTKEVGKGTGLGLSLSKGIVEEHGGTIRLLDGAKHTTFILELPSAE